MKVLPNTLDKVSISASWSSSVIKFCLNSKTKRPMFLSLYGHPTTMLQGDTRVLLQVLDRNKLCKCGWGTSSSNERVHKNILRPNSSRSCFQINCPSYAKCLTLLIERLRLFGMLLISTLVITLWLNDRPPVKVLKSLNDRQSDIFFKFKESKEHIHLKL